MEKFKSTNYENEKSLESKNLGSGEGSLELSIDGQKIIFYSREEFNPQIPEGDPIHPDKWKKFANSPAETKNEVLHRYQNSQSLSDRINSSTYEKSKDNINYQEYIRFLYDFGHTESGRDVFKKSEIEDFSQLRTLSPRQAMLLCNNTVIKLRNYDNTATQKGYQNKADKMSAIEIFNNLSKNPNQPLGICRNYVDMSRILFLAIKDFQLPEKSKLKNCFMTEVVGYNPVDLSIDAENSAGHKWARFLTFTEEGVAETFLDPTSQNLREDQYNITPADFLKYQLPESTLQNIINSIYQENIQSKGHISRESIQNSKNLYNYYSKLCREVSSLRRCNPQIDRSKMAKDSHWHFSAQAICLSKILCENGEIKEDDFAKLSRIGKNAVATGRLRSKVKEKI